MSTATLKKRSRRECQLQTTSKTGHAAKHEEDFHRLDTTPEPPLQAAIAADPILDRPPARRKAGKVGRVLAILDEIAHERPPLAVEMLVTCDARRDGNSNGREKR